MATQTVIDKGGWLGDGIAEISKTGLIDMYGGFVSGVGDG